MSDAHRTTALAGLSEQRQAEAMARFAVLRPVLDEGVSLRRAATEAGVPVRTAERWLANFREGGLAALARRARADQGARRAPAELVALIEGFGLKRPRPGVATIHRRVVELAKARGWQAPSYGTVRSILARLDPGMVTLAIEGAAAYRDRFELIHRHRAAAPNALWQADHTQLDILILDEAGKPVRPWLTTVIDDHSRAIAGTMAFMGAPSALNTSLALRFAIWRKADPAWPVCGIPDVLYVDHGSDFTSRHLDRVAADLRIRLVYSAVARPQGRGKIERLFGTLNTELLSELPGHLIGGRPTTPPKLTLAELDRAVAAFITDTYHARVHSEIGAAPLACWRAGAFLPRLPESLEQLDLLLVQHAAPRRVRRDGVRFQGFRYTSPTLAAFVGETVTVRFDPRDLTEVRLFHRDRFLCRAVSDEHASEAVALKDIEAARRAQRRHLRAGIEARVARVADFLPRVQTPLHLPSSTRRARPAAAPPRVRLRLYEEDDE